jgi:CheY-like chemotaxis protein
MPMKRVLVADDDPIFVEIVRAVLQPSGWEVTAALDSMQVMMFAMRTPAPEVILLDIDMPGGTGLAALRRLKQSSRTSSIPVVVVSGSADPTIPGQVAALGATGFLPKPIEPERFEDRLRGILRLPARA